MKQLLRKNLREKRKNQQKSIKKIKDTKICSKLEKLIEFQNAKSVLFYAPIEQEMEVDTWKLIKKYIQKKEVLLPSTEHKKRSIKIHHITSLDQLKKTNLGILEPDKKSPTEKPENIDLVIVPGIAFDEQGNRIGFGGGFYDKLLKKVKCPKVALAYDFQIMQSIPGEKHDVPMDKIITEKRVIRCSLPTS
ncbi:MAG: 5-formyltetrahydrofolate cyclo-ligase [Patescibacteria group bacterium]